MSRVLIVGCGCRGAQLAAKLLEAGHLVRGSTRREQRAVELQALGIEPLLADPDRVGAIIYGLTGVTVVCHLLGSAEGSPEQLSELHGNRLDAFTRGTVDTGVRGILYEAAGSVDPQLLASGAERAARVAGTSRVPFQTLTADPTDYEAWSEAANSAVQSLISRSS